MIGAPIGAVNAHYLNITCCHALGKCAWIRSQLAVSSNGLTAMMAEAFRVGDIVANPALSVRKLPEI